MPYKETETVKIYFSIGEVAKMFEVNSSLIRFWEKEFDIIQPKKNKKGNRLFTQLDIENFKVIYNLVKEKGYTLQGAKAKLKEGKTETINTFEIIKKLESIKQSLLELQKKLNLLVNFF